MKTRTLEYFNVIIEYIKFSVISQIFHIKNAIHCHVSKYVSYIRQLKIKISIFLRVWVVRKRKLVFWNLKTHFDSCYCRAFNILNIIIKLFCIFHYLKSQYEFLNFIFCCLVNFPSLKSESQHRFQLSKYKLSFVSFYFYSIQFF